MKKCGTKPWETIVVENAPLGVRAAVAAQCFTIAANTGPLPDKALLDEGADLNSIKELLGHSSLAATQVYTHNSIEKLRSAYDKAHPRAKKE